MNYTATGIILKKYDYGEADALFTLYTKEFGKIRGLAQGVKKETAKLKGHLETLNFSRIGFVIGKNGERLTHADALTSWPGIRADFEKAKAALHMADCIDKNCFPGEKDDMLWKHVITHFVMLERAVTVQNDFLHSFEVTLLHCLG